MRAISTKTPRLLFTSRLTACSMGIRYVDYDGVYDASFRGSTFCECASGDTSRMGDNGKIAARSKGKKTDACVVCKYNRTFRVPYAMTHERSGPV